MTNDLSVQCSGPRYTASSTFNVFFVLAVVIGWVRASTNEVSFCMLKSTAVHSLIVCMAFSARIYSILSAQDSSPQCTGIGSRGGSNWYHGQEIWTGVLCARVCICLSVIVFCSLCTNCSRCWQVFFTNSIGQSICTGAPRCFVSRLYSATVVSTVCRLSGCLFGCNPGMLSKRPANYIWLQ